MGVDNLNVSQDVVYIEAGIYHGGELLGDTLVTTEQPKSLHPRWNQWLVFETTVKNLPKAARLCLKVGGSRMSNFSKLSQIQNYLSLSLLPSLPSSPDCSWQQVSGDEAF